MTVIDINNSQEYDTETFAQAYAEEARKSSDNALMGALMGALGITAAQPNALLGWQPPQASPLATYFDTVSKAKRELTDPIEFLQRYYPGEKIWRFILTHPDLDHMRGLERLHETIGFDNFWDTAHTKTTPNFRSDGDRGDWEFYQRLRTGSVGPNPKMYTRGDSHFAFGQDEFGRVGGDFIEILSPTPDLIRTCNLASKSNSLSIVLRVWHAGKSVLLPGDAEGDAWDIIAGFYGSSLKSHFLKASHHGRDSGYHLGATKLVSPIFTVVSVGEKPDTDASNKYRQFSQRVLSTRHHGDIEIRIHDDGRHECFVDRNGDSG